MADNAPLRIIILYSFSSFFCGENFHVIIIVAARTSGTVAASRKWARTNRRTDRSAEEKESIESVFREKESVMMYLPAFLSPSISLISLNIVAENAAKITAHTARSFVG